VWTYLLSGALVVLYTVVMVFVLRSNDRVVRELRATARACERLHASNEDVVAAYNRLLLHTELRMLDETREL
jgi:hypothetical protein